MAFTSIGVLRCRILFIIDHMLNAFRIEPMQIDRQHGIRNLSICYRWYTFKFSQVHTFYISWDLSMFRSPACWRLLLLFYVYQRFYSFQWCFGCFAICFTIHELYYMERKIIGFCKFKNIACYYWNVLPFILVRFLSYFYPALFQYFSNLSKICSLNALPMLNI